MASIILVSQSPRRQQILKMAGYDFLAVPATIDESYPGDIPVVEVPEYLAKKKILAVEKDYKGELLVGADTIVVLNGMILGKPDDEKDALRMLKQLSGNMHEVITGVCIKKGERCTSFSAWSKVWFAALSDDEIIHYVKKYKPFDKAGSYGVQEYIGMIGIERIEGSFYNVMGLPIHRLYLALKKFAVFPD